jgi:hypothetical protein
MDIFIIRDNLIDAVCTDVSEHVLDGFTSIYEDAFSYNPSNVKEQYKAFLLDIKYWDDSIIERETRRIIKLFPTLRKILKTINYINIKTISLMNRHSCEIDDAYVCRQTPNVKRFIYDIYCNVAKEFYITDQIFDPINRPHQKNLIFCVIKRIISQCIPFHDLLEKVSDDDEFSIECGSNMSVLNNKTSVDFLEPSESLNLCSPANIRGKTNELDIITDEHLVRGIDKAENSFKAIEEDHKNDNLINNGVEDFNLEDISNNVLQRNDFDENIILDKDTKKHENDFQQEKIEASENSFDEKESLDVSSNIKNMFESNNNDTDIMINNESLFEDIMNTDEKKRKNSVKSSSSLKGPIRRMHS